MSRMSGHAIDVANGETRKCQAKEFGPYSCGRAGTVLMDDVGLRPEVRLLLCEKCAAAVRKILGGPKGRTHGQD